MKGPRRVRTRPSFVREERCPCGACGRRLWRRIGAGAEAPGFAGARMVGLVSGCVRRRAPSPRSVDLTGLSGGPGSPAGRHQQGDCVPGRGHEKARRSELGGPANSGVARSDVIGLCAKFASGVKGAVKSRTSRRWHECQDSNPDRMVLETSILPLNHTRIGTGCMDRTCLTRSTTARHHQIGLA